MLRIYLLGVLVALGCGLALVTRPRLSEPVRRAGAWSAVFAFAWPVTLPAWLLYGAARALGRPRRPAPWDDVV